MQGWSKLIVLFVLGACLASIGDWFHVHTQTTSYPPERYVWYIQGIPFWIPILFGVAATFFGWVYTNAKAWFGGRLSFKEGAKLSDAGLAGLVYMAVHISSGYLSHWPFPLPDMVLALPVVLIWLLLDRTRGGACFSLFVGLIGVSAEISLVHLGVFSFSNGADQLFGVATWLPWVYISAGLAISRFLEFPAVHRKLEYARHAIYSEPSTVYIVERKNKRRCFKEAVEISGFIAHLNRACQESGKEKEEFRVAIKPNIMTAAYEADVSVCTDVELVEYLIDKIWHQDYRDIKVVESRMVWSNFYHKRTVKNVAEMVGYSSDGYDVVDLTETMEEGYDYGDNELGMHPAGPAWRDADYRISFAKNKTHFQCYYTGCMKNVYGCLPMEDKFKWYHGRGREFHSCTIVILEAFPVHFAFLDAYFSGDGLAGLIRDSRPNETNTIICGENCFAVDWVQGLKMGLKQPQKNYVIRRAMERWGEPRIRIFGPMEPWGEPRIDIVGPDEKNEKWKNIWPYVDTIANLVEESYWLSRGFGCILAYRMHRKFKPVRDVYYWCTCPLRWLISFCDCYAKRILIPLILFVVILVIIIYRS